MKTVLQTLLLTLAGSALFAQQPYSESVEVRVVNVDVVVTDRSGKPVEGLEPDDFIVFEGGKEQPLTNFYEVRGSKRTQDSTSRSTEATSDPRIRRIAILLDNQTMVPTTRNAAISKVKEFLPGAKRPDDEVMIATIFNGLTIDLQFTKDLKAVMAALDVAQKSPVNGVRMQQARRDLERELRDLPENYSLQSINAGGQKLTAKPPYTDAINNAQHYANMVKHNVSQSTDAAVSFLQSLAGIEGRKIVLLATQSMPTYAGQEAFEYLEAMKAEFAGGESHQPVSENMNLYDVSPLVVRLADVANRSGVTLYPLQVGGPTHILTTSDESNADDVNYRSQTGFKGAQASSAMASSAVLPFLADQTGGVALIESSNLGLMFDRIASDLGSYYSLGYRPSREAMNVPKPIEVKLRTDSNYLIRYRRGLIERTPEATQQAEVTAALSHDAQKNDMGIALQILESQPAEGGGTKVPVKIVIPMDSLTLMPDGEDLVGKISIFVRFARNDGVMSEVSRRTNDFRFPASTRSKRKNLTIQTDFTIQPDIRRVSVGVVDEVSQVTGFANYDPPAK